MEKWKTIPNFSGYEASTLGNIRSLNYKRTGKVKVLKPGLSPDGYLKTMILDDNGKYRSWTIHLFVALAFIGEKPDGLEIDHINGIKTDNRLENLEYVTRSENVKRAFKLGLMTPKRGELNGMAKLTSQDVADIREYVKKNARFRKDGVRYGYNRKALAEKYNISDSHIKDIISGRRGVWS